MVPRLAGASWDMNPAALMNAPAGVSPASLVSCQSVKGATTSRWACMVSREGHTSTVNVCRFPVQSVVSENPPGVVMRSSGNHLVAGRRRSWRAPTVRVGNLLEGQWLAYRAGREVGYVGKEGA